jgi:hypothetical protein
MTAEKRTKRTQESIFCVFLVALLFVILTAHCVCLACAQANKDGTSANSESSKSGKDGVWDPNKYIAVEEIEAGTQGYCLTCMEGTKVERFDLEVLSVVPDFEPGRAAILVQLTGDRFLHTGPVAGCSGSPVYIDDRLAGALAAAWTYSKDPLFAVTPIKEMLKVGQGSHAQPRDRRRVYGFDYAKPIDFSVIEGRMHERLSEQRQGVVNSKSVPGLLVSSNLPGRVCKRLDALAEPFGFMVAAGGCGKTQEGQQVRLEPGSCLAVPWVTGDITMTVMGTVTEVAGDKVYGFGHGYLGYGAVELPMATGQVHAVVSSVYRSFKVGSALETVGALTMDQSTAVVGTIGAEAPTIPLTVRVRRYNDSEVRQYDCEIVDNELLTPVGVNMVVLGAALVHGELPPNHTIKYDMVLKMNNHRSIRCENVSTGRGLTDMISDSVGPIAMLMDNPYEEVDITSMEFSMSIEPESSVSHIWSVELSDSRVKPGQKLDVQAVVESYLAERKKYRFSVEIPAQLKQGKYELIVCGSRAYEQFLRKTVPYRFVAQNMQDLIEALNDLLQIRRDVLHCLLILPAGGIKVEKAGLPDLPATKALVLQSGSRTIRTRPHPQWIEKRQQIDSVVIDRESMHIQVEP